MDRVSDAKLEWLIDGLHFNAWKMKANLQWMFRSALEELKERREAEKPKEWPPIWDPR